MAQPTGIGPSGPIGSLAPNAPDPRNNTAPPVNGSLGETISWLRNHPNYGATPPPPTYATSTPTPSPASTNQTSAWTGVSSNSDPYGVAGIGYTLPTGLDRNTLLSLNSPQSNQVNPPSGPSSYENQDPAALSAGTSQNSAWASQQPAVAQANVQAQQAPQYPSYPNSFGLGGGLGTAPQAAPANSGSSYTGQGITVSVPDTSSRGFNPWSLQGESNARDTSKGVVAPSAPGGQPSYGM